MLSLVQVTLKISFICCHSTPNNPFRAEEVIDSSWKTWCSGYRRLRISCLPDLSSYSLGGRRAEEVIDSSSNDLVQRVQEASAFHSTLKEGFAGQYIFSLWRRADEVIDSSSEDLVQRVQDITGSEGAWAGLDPVAGSFTSTVSRLNMRNRYKNSTFRELVMSGEGTWAGLDPPVGGSFTSIVCILQSCNSCEHFLS